MGQVAAVRQVHAEHRVAGLQRRHVDGDVRLRAGVRLHVGVLGAEKLLGAVDGELLGAVHEFAAAVIALAGIAFGIFVGEHRAHGFEHGFGDEIFRGDQLEAGGLAAHFVAQRFSDFRIHFVERRLMRRSSGVSFFISVAPCQDFLLGITVRNQHSARGSRNFRISGVFVNSRRFYRSVASFAIRPGSFTAPGSRRSRVQTNNPYCWRRLLEGDGRMRRNKC